MLVYDNSYNKITPVWLLWLMITRFIKCDYITCEIRVHVRRLKKNAEVILQLQSLPCNSTALFLPQSIGFYVEASTFAMEAFAKTFKWSKSDNRSLPLFRNCYKLIFTVWDVMMGWFMLIGYLRFKLINMCNKAVYTDLRNIVLNILSNI